MKQILLVVLSLTSLLSLAQSTDIHYKKKTQQKPEINEIKIVDIGSPIYINEEYQYVDGVKLINVPTFKIASFNYNLVEGKELPYNYNKKKLDVFYDESTNVYSDHRKAYLGIGIDEADIIYAIYDTNFYFQKKQIEGLEIEKITYINPDCNNCFRYELIYNGKSQNVLNFTYREYKGDFIRPSFNQELKYSLEDGNIIGFKTLRIEIINTNNFGIEYKVISY